MFSKTDKSSEEPVEAEAPSLMNANRSTTRSAPSLLGTDLQITGDVTSEGDLQIDGKVEGDVKSVTLTVGEKAQIKGEIICDRALIHGTVTGRVTAKDVYLSKTARIVGDINHDLVAIERGAFVDGQIRRRQSGQAAAKPAVAPPAKPAAEASSDKPAATPASTSRPQLS